MPRLVPSKWLDSSPMHSVFFHWTAGAYRASELDKEHYHIIVEGDGRLVRGDHTIADNTQVGDNDYAAHTGRHNTKAIGVAVACMRGAVERPFRPGPSPMTQKQWDAMLVVGADLVEHYGIKIEPKSCCGHGRVYAHHGQKNYTGKWDPLKLPWAPNVTPDQVDQAIRDGIRAVIQGGRGVEDNDRPITLAYRRGDAEPVVLTSECYLGDIVGQRAATWVPIRLVCDTLGLIILEGDGDRVLIRNPGGDSFVLPFDIQGNTGYSPIRPLKEKLNGRITLGWDPAERTVLMTDNSPVDTGR